MQKSSARVQRLEALNVLEGLAEADRIAVLREGFSRAFHALRRALSDDPQQIVRVSEFVTTTVYSRDHRSFENHICDLNDRMVIGRLTAEDHAVLASVPSDALIGTGVDLGQYIAILAKGYRAY